MNMIHDMVGDTETGETYKQLNMKKTHSIPIGTLVEIESGARVFVVDYDRDCDGTPLYSLYGDRQWTELIWSGVNLRGKWLNGYTEDSLEIIKPYINNNIKDYLRLKILDSGKISSTTEPRHIWANNRVLSSKNRQMYDTYKNLFLWLDELKEQTDESYRQFLVENIEASESLGKGKTLVLDDIHTDDYDHIEYATTYLIYNEVLELMKTEGLKNNE